MRILIFSISLAASPSPSPPPSPPRERRSAQVAYAKVAMPAPADDAPVGDEPLEWELSADGVFEHAFRPGATEFDLRVEVGRRLAQGGQHYYCRRNFIEYFC